MNLDNKYYDALKWLVLIFLPALAVLASGLGDLYAWAPTSQLVATINLVAVFLGALIQKSSLDYWKKGGDDLITAVAWDVIRGEYGNGEERVRELTEAGYDYQTVQDRVNQLLS